MQRFYKTSKMIAEELINQMIPPLRLDDAAGKALNRMEEFRCSHLPVVDQERLLGFIGHDLLLENTNSDKTLREFSFAGEECSVPSDAHFFEVLKTSSDHHIQLVAVENNLRQYLGVISVNDLAPLYAPSSTAQTPGSILVFSMELISYSLAEMARLVEENKGKIMSSIAIEDPLDNSRIRLVLKIDQPDLTRIVATFERFDYKIIGRYQEGKFTEPDRERFELLMRYLNI